MPSEYLLVSGEPSASMTASEVKFSDAMSSMPERCRRFSRSMRSYTSGSASDSKVSPHFATGSIAAAAVAAWLAVEIAAAAVEGRTGPAAAAARTSGRRREELEGEQKRLCFARALVVVAATAAARVDGWARPCGAMAAMRARCSVECRGEWRRGWG
jgi:hypothetical protein